MVRKTKETQLMAILRAARWSIYVFYEFVVWQVFNEMVKLVENFDYYGRSNREKVEGKCHDSND